MFRFKQFTINDEHCAMKVGTDGVLLGAWAEVKAGTIIDIGCGSGLIALMVAQRNPDARVIGIEIDTAAAEDARRNVKESPFEDRVEIRVGDALEELRITNYELQKTHSIAFVCNPPFYTEDTLPPDEARATARNNRSLPLDKLMEKYRTMVVDNDLQGTLSLVLPSVLEQRIIELAHLNTLHVTRLTRVRTTPRKEAKRILVEISPENTNGTPVVTMITLMNPDGSRSEEYSTLTKDFYL